MEEAQWQLRFTQVNTWRNFIFGLAGLAWTVSADAKVIRIQWDNSEAPSHGDYVTKKGRVIYAVDPKLPQNQGITDLNLAKTNEQGWVEFSGEVTLQHPKDPSKSNGLAWVHIPNRGGASKLTREQMAQGTTLMNVAWEFDLPEAPKRLRLQVPQVKQANGQAIVGRVSQTFIPEAKSTSVTLSDLWLYPPLESESPEPVLKRLHRAGFPEGTEVPKSDWVLEGNELKWHQPLEAGATYEISYLSKDPYVGGLGYAAVRDAVTWLKHGKSTPVKIRHAVAYGSSQCGRFLRDYLFLGFNQNESGGKVFDGVISHVAGAGRLILNERWSKPRSGATFDTASFPFADRVMKHPLSDQWLGVLENGRTHYLPNLMYINTASEYWGAGRAAGLTHSDLAGKTDEAFFYSVRSYFYSGTQHGAAAFPPEKVAPDGQYVNPVKADEITESLRVAMEQWVVNKVLPPDSVVPTHREGTLVRAEELRWPKLPGVRSPIAFSAGMSLVLPSLHEPNSSWPMPLLVPQVDEDGNDLGGIRMPEVAVPLATSTGWVHRAPSMGNAQEAMVLKGSWIPFAKTREERLRTGDPRLSIEERYASREIYLKKTQEVIRDLVEQRFLMEKHIPVIMKRAEERWNYLIQE